MKNIKILAAALAAATLAGCAHVPHSASRINLITEHEAAVNHCQKLTYVGSASAILINGKARNTAVIVQKALRVKGATHITFTKGEPGYAFTKANVWRCPNPNLQTKDEATRLYQNQYMHH